MSTNQEKLYLNFNYNSKALQPLHIDIQNKFTVLCKLSHKDNNEINSIEIHLLEPKNKKEYELHSAKYVKIDKNKMHHIEVNIEDNTSEAPNKKVDMALNGLKKMSHNDFIDIHIISENRDIASKSIRPRSNFGQHFCKSIVINTLNP